jgi:hypothetical protein
MADADAKAKRPQMNPHEVSAYAATSPLLTVHAATESENAAKERWIRPAGSLDRMRRPSPKVERAVKAVRAK